MNEQVKRSFDEKWGVLGRNYGHSAAEFHEIFEHLTSILGVETLDGIMDLYKDNYNILDAGCGVASSEVLFNVNPKANFYAVDISEGAIEVAINNLKGFKNVEVLNADIFNLPYAAEFFNIIISDGVLHHTSDPRGGFKKLCYHLKHGGLIGIYIYCKKPMLRETSDKEIRKITTKMDFDKCYEFSKQMAFLGRSLSRIGTDLVIDVDISLLGIEAGTYNLQSFIYDHFVKCFWNDNLGGIDFSSLTNFDWYSPDLASHHTKKEIIEWFEENEIENPKFVQPKGYKYAGYFVSGRKK